MSLQCVPACLAQLKRSRSAQQLSKCSLIDLVEPADGNLELQAEEEQKEQKPLDALRQGVQLSAD